MKLGTPLRYLILFFLLFLLAVMSGGAVAFHYYGVAGLLLAFLAVVAGLALLKTFVARAARHMLLRSLNRQAEVLHKATAHIHSVTPTVAPSYASDEPYGEDEEYDYAGDYDEEDEFEDSDEELGSGEPEEDDEEYGGPYNWYYIDVTITPRPNQPLVDGKPPEWSAGELTLVPADSADALPFDFMGWCDLADFEEWDGVGWEMAREETSGARRLRLHVGLKPGVSEWRLCYWTEVFGDVVFVDE